MSDVPVKTVLLLGKTGEGKSFIGNLILGRIVFVTSGASASVTQKCRKQSAVNLDFGTEFQVVDTIGLFDTSKCTEDVHEILSEFATLAPNGIHAVLVVIPGDRFKESTFRTLGAIEGFFGKDIWAHSIVVYNQCEKTVETIMQSDAKSEQKYLEKWRIAGTTICTLPFAEVDEGTENMPVNGEGQIRLCPRMEPRVTALKEAIRDSDKIYDPEEFRTLRGELQELAKQALQVLKTDQWQQQMTAHNKLLLDGRVDREAWEKSRAEILEQDASAARTEKQLAAARYVGKTAMVGAVITGTMGGTAAYRAGATGTELAMATGKALFPGVERAALLCGDQIASLVQDAGPAASECVSSMWNGNGGDASS